WFVFSSRGRHTRFSRDWSSDVCSSDLSPPRDAGHRGQILEPLPVGSTTRGKASGGFGGFSHGNNPTGTGPGGSRDSGNAGVSHRSEERRVGKECRWRSSPATIRKRRDD